MYFKVNDFRISLHCWMPNQRSFSLSLCASLQQFLNFFLPLFCSLLLFFYTSGGLNWKLDNCVRKWNAKSGAYSDLKWRCLFITDLSRQGTGHPLVPLNSRGATGLRSSSPRWEPRAGIQLVPSSHSQPDHAQDLLFPTANSHHGQ